MNGARNSSSQQRKQSSINSKLPVKNMQIAQQALQNQYRTVQPSVLTSQVGQNALMNQNYSQVHAKKI